MSLSLALLQGGANPRSIYREPDAPCFWFRNSGFEEYALREYRQNLADGRVADFLQTVKTGTSPDLVGLGLIQ